jgi:predicted Holliday junction resolvase-like endonuclease
VSENVLFAIAALFVAFSLGFLFGRIARYLSVRRERSDAVKRSQSVILGSVYEKILPFLPGFPYSPKDMVFIGKGFDYLVLDGISEGNLKRVVFLEVKTGTSKLNANERQVRSVVESRKVAFEEYRADAPNFR